MLDGLFSGIAQVLDGGGWVAWILVGVSVLMWYCATLRIIALSPRIVDRYRVAALRVAKGGIDCCGRLDSLADEAHQKLQALRGVLRTLVAVAPLLGLLGTVGGMVETFVSLGVAKSTEATVAGGISTALITTQLGLSIGILGLVVARLLERREARLGRMVESVRARVSAQMRAEAGGAA